MGRKNRNISNERDIDKDKDIEEDEELSIQQENIEERTTQQIIVKEDLIWDIRHKMMKYCDNTAIPLCDYLTPEIFNQFIEYLIENN